MKPDLEIEVSSGNVLYDIGYPRPEAELLLVKSHVISTVGETMRRRKLPTARAAKTCGTDRCTLAKVLRGRMLDVSLDVLFNWLTALGRTVEIRVTPYRAKVRTGHLLTIS